MAFQGHQDGTILQVIAKYCIVIASSNHQTFMKGFTRRQPANCWNKIFVPFVGYYINKILYPENEVVILKGIALFQWEFKVFFAKKNW